MSQKVHIAALIMFSFFLGLLWNTIHGRSPHIFPREAHAEENIRTEFDEAVRVQEAFRTISAEISPSVVEITVQSEDIVGVDSAEEEVPWGDFFVDPSEESEGPQYFRSNGLGSGVIVEQDDDWSYIVTNAHVLGKAQNISIQLYDGEFVTGEFIAKDERKDLAVIRIPKGEPVLPVASFGDSDYLYVGDWVLAIGSPYGYGHSVSAGIVSALGRSNGPGENINDFIQTDASINQGNSGGPLLNIHGEVIGINTFITTPNRGSIGLGFAIPSNNVKSSVRQLISYGEVRYGWLGVSLGTYGLEAAEALGYAQKKGVLVYQVYKDSPADKADLRAGDLILSFDGKRYDDYERLIYRIGDKAPGDTAVFKVNRFGTVVEVSVLMSERGDKEEVQSMHNLAKPGFVPAPMTEELREMMQIPSDVKGVPIAEVYPRTSAQAVDLRNGDIVTAVNGNLTPDLPSLYLALGTSLRDIPFFTVYRNGDFVELVHSPLE